MTSGIIQEQYAFLLGLPSSTNDVAGVFKYNNDGSFEQTDIANSGVLKGKWIANDEMVTLSYDGGDSKNYTASKMERKSEDWQYVKHYLDGIFTYTLKINIHLTR